MIEDLLSDEKVWIMILVILFIIFVLGIFYAMIAVIAWLTFLWWSKYRIRIPPSGEK
jgi:hypothetical protein